MTSSPHDPILHQLLAQADADSLAFGITLYMPWGIASGMATSRAQFDIDCAEWFRERNAEALEAVFSSDVEGSAEDGYIHLSRAKCYAATTVQHHDVLRLRLSDVIAWTIGLPEDPKTFQAPPPMPSPRIPKI